MMGKVVIESPLKGDVPKWVPWPLRRVWERLGRWRNQRYAMACVRDSLARGEAPYASHVFFDRPGLLDDASPEERKLGIQAGLAWGQSADLRAVYTDRGISRGMQLGIESSPAGQFIEYRTVRHRMAGAKRGGGTR